MMAALAAPYCRVESSRVVSSGLESAQSEEKSRANINFADHSRGKGL